MGGPSVPRVIALATPPVAASVDEGLATVRRLIGEAADRRADIVCFPEAYVPGLRGLDFPVPDFGPRDEERVVREVARSAREAGVAVVLGTETVSSGARRIAAVVFDRTGAVVGTQTKNQLDPAEERHYVPGAGRRMFDLDGIRFGVTICHEGFRYPETVRWAATRGAKIVFHPHCTGSDRSGTRPARWLDPDAPYYEKAMTCRALENTVYFASVNYAFALQESATSLIDPLGRCVAAMPYGRAGLLVETIDLALATGLLAGRYAPERHREAE